MSIPISQHPLGTVPGCAELPRRKTDDEWNAELSKQVLKRTDKLNDTSIDMALRIKQAREFIEWSTTHMRSVWLDWLNESDACIKNLTQFRMAFDRETKTVVSSAKDIKEFFGSSEYSSAHEKLKEMVGLMDRFSELKSNGTLDAFADFILKVSCK